MYAPVDVVTCLLCGQDLKILNGGYLRRHGKNGAQIRTAKALNGAIEGLRQRIVAIQRELDKETDQDKIRDLQQEISDINREIGTAKDSLVKNRTKMDISGSLEVVVN